MEGSEQPSLKKKEIDYFKVVAEWNASLRTNRNKIRLLVGEMQANNFLDYQDDFRQNEPQSLHYRFVKAHRSAMRVKKKEMAAASAQVEVDKLNWACSDFLEGLTTDFLKRAASLQLLEMPESSQIPQEKTKQAV